MELGIISRAVPLLLLLGVLGSIVYWLRSKLFFSISVTRFEKDNMLFRKLVKWLGRNIPDLQNFEYIPSWKFENNDPKQREKSSRSIRGDASEIDSTDDDEPRQHSSPTRIKVKYLKVPSAGTHYFRYQDCLIRVQISSWDSEVGNITFTTLSKNSKLLEGILEGAKTKTKCIRSIKRYRKHEISVFYPKSCLTEWEPLNLQSTKRPFETLVFADNLGEKLLTDVEKFLTKEEWYYKKGIPWRKTYLLHGPSGCGKSSLVKAIAGKIGFDICVLPLTERLTDENIMRLINSAPRRSVILMEEVDAAFQKGLEEDAVQDPSEYLVYSSKTFTTLSVSGFYNALDGIGSPEDGLMIFMTSHHPERLDRSLIRPGRVDYHVLLDYPNKSQLERMFERFFPEADASQKQRFLRVVKDCQDLDIKVSVAMIQGLFVKYSDSVEQVLEGAEEFMRHKFSDTNNNNSSSHIYM